MANFQLLVALALVILLPGAGAALSKAVTANNETFDYLTLSQEWPYTFCTENECNNTDKLQPVFNIHGLWPEHVNGECHGEFNYSQLKPLESKLRLFWMDLKDPLGSPKEFWQHEYDKHGSCATVDPKFNTTLKYFESALATYLKYNITHILMKAGIVPGSTPYPVSKIMAAVTAVFGYKPEVKCFVPEKLSPNGKADYYLRELHVCFTKDLKPRECSSSARRVHPDHTLLYEPQLPNGKIKYDNEKLAELKNTIVSAEKVQQPTDPKQCTPDDHVLLPDGPK